MLFCHKFHPRKHKYLERKKKFSPRKNLSFLQLRLDVSLMGKIIVQTSRLSIIHLYSLGGRNIPQAFRMTARQALQAADDNKLLLMKLTTPLEPSKVSEQTLSDLSTR